jgi:outer membrane protein OmpA-like peptidoglycan-associated protein
MGPYVAKWFTTHNDESLLRYERQRVWLAARDAGELMKHLSRLYLQPEPVRITLFFPFLPDGHDTAALATSALMSWTRTLQSIVLPEPLPCVFAIYACFSQQRFAWDPDRIIWSGEAPLFSSGSSLDQSISTLLTLFEQQRSMSDASLAQRHATLVVLRQWLEDTRLMSALNAFLNSPFLSLTHCLVADYGCGFVRHGAWARWLEEKYAILPALAKSRIELSLPELSVPASPSPVVLPPPAERQRNGLFLPLMIGLVVGASMLAASLCERHRGETTEALLAQFRAVADNDIVHKFEVLDRLEAHQAMLARCADSDFFQNWGFSECSTLLSNVSLQLNPYTPWIIYSSSGPSSLFASGNYTILPAQIDRLESLGLLVQRNPSVVFQIVGHSDNSGDEQRNLWLSEQRAREVRDWLIKQIHADANRFDLKGVGDAFPLMSNSTPEGKEVNRRIEVIPLHPTILTDNEKIN